MDTFIAYLSADTMAKELLQAHCYRVTAVTDGYERLALRSAIERFDQLATEMQAVRARLEAITRKEAA